MKKAVVYSIGVLFLCCSFSCYRATEESGKIIPEQNIEQSKFVRLNPLGGVDPEVLTVRPGTTVVWVNHSRTQTRLKFLGKQVTLACKSPVHFMLDDDGSFISDLIPPDSVASLCFVEKGVFDYVVRKEHSEGGISPRRDSVDEYKGKVVVE